MHKGHILLFWYAYVRLEKSPLLWTCSFSCCELVASPVVNFHSEVSSGVRLCPEALPLKTIHGNYPISLLRIKNSGVFWAFFCIQGLQKTLFERFPVRDGIIYKYNCVKDMFPLWLTFVFPHCFSPISYMGVITRSNWVTCVSPHREVTSVKCTWNWGVEHWP